jgi:sulfite reductase (NADPH) hemoprotein beta-component
MYRYTDIDQRLVDERVAQFRDQTARYLAGQLSEDEFRPLRLQNGLYVQKHAPMLRVAIPYGLLDARQLRTLARIARDYDRGYGHFTTRQNIQFNWVELDRVPDLLAELARVQMHAIQTSGNCIRNITTDHFAGIAPDEVVNPLVWAELLRQWSTLHPEFAWLPRKFKIALSGSPADRAATLVHDIGLIAHRDDRGEVVFRVAVGGGLGRTPIVGSVIREALPAADLLGYLEAILRVYNRFGRRDNKYKARIKILLRELGPDDFTARVETEFQRCRANAPQVTAEWLGAIAERFEWPEYRALEEPAPAEPPRPSAYAAWLRRNVHAHRVAGYRAVTISLKRRGVAPGDLTASEMEAVADLADRYSQGHLRVTHEQNLLLPAVAAATLPALWRELDALGLARANVGLIGNVICCPGGDYCALANAVSIPVAQAIMARFEALDFQFDVGELDLNISGCINACGHHHVGHIGILGVDKQGESHYQITIGGRQGPEARIGRILGPSVAEAEVPDAIESLLATYLELREHEDERFVDVVERLGITPFKERLYAAA